MAGRSLESAQGFHSMLPEAKARKISSEFCIQELLAMCLREEDQVERGSGNGPPVRLLLSR